MKDYGQILVIQLSKDLQQHMTVHLHPSPIFFDPPWPPLTSPTAIPSSLKRILSSCPLTRHGRLHTPRGTSGKGVGSILQSCSSGGQRDTRALGSDRKGGGRYFASSGRLKCGYLAVPPRCGLHRPFSNHSATITWVWRGWSSSLRQRGGGGGRNG